MPAKPKRPQPETPNEVQGRDRFETPLYAVDLLVPFIPRSTWTIWECAAGRGRMTAHFRGHGFDVRATDIEHPPILNFLTDEPDFQWDMIATNPPFSGKVSWYQQCRKYEMPFALLVPADFSQWIWHAIHDDGCRIVMPERRIDYITSNGKSGKESASQFQSMWLTRDLLLPDRLTLVELTNEDKRNI